MRRRSCSRPGSGSVALFGESGSDRWRRSDAGPNRRRGGGVAGRAGARLDAAGDEDRQEMIDLMEAIRDAQAAGDAAALDQARTQLTDLLFYLET